MDDVEVTGPVHPRQMYECDRELVLSGGSPSFTLNNLSALSDEPRLATYISYASRNVVHVVSWDVSLTNVCMESLPLKESGRDKPLCVIACKLCLPLNRTLPVCVVASVLNVMIIDVKNLKILASTPIDSNGKLSEPDVGYKFARGITCVENFIVVGLYTGDMLLFMCTGESRFEVKTAPQVHTAAIVDCATCIYDLITVTADVSGLVVVWDKSMRKVVKKISTGHQISAINILRKQAFCATYMGQVFVYAVQTGALLAEMNVHSRTITALCVAPESAYVLTASEDGYVRIFKLHSRKPENYQLEYRYSEKTEQPIVGAYFINNRGSGYTIAQFEHNKLPIYTIRKVQ